MRCARFHTGCVADPVRKRYHQHEKTYRSPEQPPARRCQRKAELVLAKNMRVHELAKKLGMTNAEMMALCDAMGVGVKTHSSTLIEAQADRLERRAIRDGLTRPEQPEEQKPVKKTAAKKAAAARQLPLPTPPLHRGGQQACAGEEGRRQEGRSCCCRGRARVRARPGRHSPLQRPHPLQPHRCSTPEPEPGARR